MDIKTKFAAPPSLDDLVIIGRRTSYFDITEDDRIDEYSSQPQPPADDVSHLLYTPLPADLPTLNKDILILMAAYYGDVDRYSRLRRPHLALGELDCRARNLPQHNVR